MSFLKEIAATLLYQLETGLILCEYNGPAGRENDEVSASKTEMGQNKSIATGFWHGVPISGKSVTNLAPSRFI
jgi:hypothetical protein